MSIGAKGSLSHQQQMEEILSVTQRTRATSQQKEDAKQKDSRFANIEANPFFVAVFNEATTPDEKQQEIARLTTFPETKEEARENEKSFAIFKEYLQSVREEMAVDTIKMSDPKNFAVLRDTYDSMNGALIDFENKIAPLTELLEALEDLRVNGETMDVFREIKSDNEREAAIKAREQELLAQIETAKKAVTDIETRIAVLDEDKNFFGQVRKNAREEQARLSVQKGEAIANVDNVAKEVDKFRAENSSNNDSVTKNADAKKKLREMLDLSSEAHEQRGNDLIHSAVEFVANSKEKIGTIRDHLSSMESQINNLYDSNYNMSYVYALLDGGSKIGEENNKKLRVDLETTPETESAVERLTREGKKRDLDEFMGRMETSGNDTIATMADLASQSIRIKDMKDSNQGQIQMAQEMHARGVAGVADRISTVIQAVGQAALSESSQMAAHTLNAMRQNTDMIAQKHSIQVALEIQERNVELENAIANLEQYGKVHQEATKITRSGITDMRSLIDRMEETAKGVAEDVSKSYALVADEVSGSVNTSSKNGNSKTSSSGVKSPFGR